MLSCIFCSSFWFIFFRRTQQTLEVATSGCYNSVMLLVKRGKSIIITSGLLMRRLEAALSSLSIDLPSSICSFVGRLKLQAADTAKLLGCFHVEGFGLKPKDFRMHTSSTENEKMISRTDGRTSNQGKAGNPRTNEQDTGRGSEHAFLPRFYSFAALLQCHPPSLVAWMMSSLN